MAGGSGWCGELPEKALDALLSSRGCCLRVRGYPPPGCGEPELGLPFLWPQRCLDGLGRAPTPHLPQFAPQLTAEPSTGSLCSVRAGSV